MEETKNERFMEQVSTLSFYDHEFNDREVEVVTKYLRCHSIFLGTD